MTFQKNATLTEFERLNSQINEFYYEIAVSQGLSESAYSILQAILTLGNGCTQTDIYRYSGMNKQTVNSSAKRLRQEGWITFQSGIGREQKIFLTEAGEKIVAEKILPIEQAESSVFAEMTENEQAEILRLVNKYLTSFREKVRKLTEEQEV